MAQVVGSTTDNTDAVVGTNTGPSTGPGDGGRFTSTWSEGCVGISTNNNGVHGKSSSSTNSGVWAENAAGGTGVTGSTSSPNQSGQHAGVWGINADAGVGVYGSANGSGYGVVGADLVGVTGSSTSASGYGVWATNTATNGIAAECYGTGTGGIGVQGKATANSARGVYGISGQNSSTTNSYAIYGYAYGTTANGNYAGYFDGAISKTSGTFLIDHPLDPANKWLSHSFVESPDMKNVYDGIAVADEHGEASIEMPSYFEALNSEFRYQLTAIGVAAPSLHVKQELISGRFVVAGANSGQKISWQVTGIRKDAWVT